MTFTLPETLPESIEELEALLHQAEAEFDELAAGLNEDGAVVSEDTLTAMQALNEAAEQLHTLIGERRAVDETRLAEARTLAEARAAREAPEPEPESAEQSEQADTADPVEEAERITADAADEQVAVTAGASFRGLGRHTGRPISQVAPPREIGFTMSPGAPRYQQGLVGYQELAMSLDSMASGATIRTNRDGKYGKVAMSLATVERRFSAGQIVDDQQGLQEAIEEATRDGAYQAPRFDDAGALVASGGWCAPSETLYDFCDVPAATELVSVPEISITRGGIRWPEEPDLTELYATLPFRYTEAQLQATTPPTKPCVEVPCPGFDEIRPEAVGLCITAGILQKRGWPELIAKFLAEALNAHQHALSKITIQDMVAGSTAVAATAGIAAGSAVLNALALAATNIRIIERLPRSAVVEGVAPVWLAEVLRADLALQAGRDVKAVTDAEVDAWLSARNIRLQYVVDWQTRGAGEPGSATTVKWPATVKVLLYPSGAWFRHLSNVIEVGTLYDKAQLQLNRYTELFTEDQYFTARRCRTSQVVTVPICPTGAIGDRTAVTCA